MILTCPECATSYFAADAAIGQGRMVRCAGCGASWRAAPERALELTVSPEEGAVAVAADELATPGADDILERPVSDLAGDELPKAFRARAQAERRVREAAAQGVIWAGLGAAFALIAALAVVFRLDVVQVWPKAASAYAAIGLPVNRIGLDIEDVHAQPSLQDGRPALLVSGVLRNIRARPVTAPPLSIALMDKDGKRLMVRSASPGDSVVPAGQTRTFAVSLLNPPSAASDLVVGFVMDQRAGVPAPARVAAPSPPPAQAPNFLRQGPTSLADLAPPTSATAPGAPPGQTAPATTP